MRPHKDWRVGLHRVDELIAGDNEDGQVEMVFHQNWHQ
jgi:hypothetical protein